jgi:hypothetical protein
VEGRRNLILGAILNSPHELRTDEPLVDRLSKIIREAMQPFVHGTVWISIFPIDLFDDTVTLEIEIPALPWMPFRYKYSRSHMDRAYYPNDYLITDIREDLFNHFRYRPSLPIDDHIILGEE